jgi:hypothetical protein
MPSWPCVRRHYHPRHEPTEHLDNSDEQGAGAATQPGIDQPARGQQVQDGRALGGAATGHRIEASLVGRRPTAAALGDVQNDGDAGAVEPIAQLGVAALGKELAGEGLKFEGDSIGVELFGVEERVAGEERRSRGL